MHLKSDIKQRPKEIGKDCSWLAEQCGVSIHTVYGWMSSRRSIPAKSRVRIGELMGEVKQPLGVIREVQAGSFKALQPENTILRAWIALHLKPSEVVDIDKWVRNKMEES